MHAIKFKYSDKNANDFGIEGWVLKSAPLFDPSLDMGIAHDVIEHKKGDKGTIEEEIEATGAFLFTRIESGYLASISVNKEDAEILADNVLTPIISLTENYSGFSKLVNEGLVFSQASQSVNRLSDYAESTINRAMLRLKEKLRNPQTFDHSGLSEEEIDQLTLSLGSRASINKIRSLLRAGYRRAYGRFNGDYCLASDALLNCKKAVNKAQEEFVNRYGAIINDSTLSVSVNGKTGEVSARIDSPRFYAEPFLSLGAVVSYRETRIFNKSVGVNQDF